MCATPMIRLKTMIFIVWLFRPLHRINIKFMIIKTTDQLNSNMLLSCVANGHLNISKIMCFFILVLKNWYFWPNVRPMIACYINIWSNTENETFFLIQWMYFFENVQNIYLFLWYATFPSFIQYKKYRA